MKKIIAATAIALALPFLSASAAQADDGYGPYTTGGRVLITIVIADSGCGTAEWPKGGENMKCESYQTYQGPIESGDTFGVKFTSQLDYSGCSVVDVESGNTLARESAGPGETANCMLDAK